MPLYEFQCQKCRNIFTVLAKSVAEPVAAECLACGSKDIVRTISRFAYHKSTATVWEESGEPEAVGSPDFYKDPRNIGRWTEKKFKEMGMEVPPEVNEKIQAAREGELPPALKE